MICSDCTQCGTPQCPSMTWNFEASSKSPPQCRYSMRCQFKCSLKSAPNIFGALGVTETGHEELVVGSSVLNCPVDIAKTASILLLSHTTTDFHTSHIVLALQLHSIRLHIFEQDILHSENAYTFQCLM